MVTLFKKKKRRIWYDVFDFVLGSMREIDVIDVSKQEDCKMLMREWTEYYNSPNRAKIFNVISLEFSNTRWESWQAGFIMFSTVHTIIKIIFSSRRSSTVYSVGGFSVSVWDKLHIYSHDIFWYNKVLSRWELILITKNNWSNNFLFLQSSIFA